jgi:hypothetical protein
LLNSISGQVRERRVAMRIKTDIRSTITLCIIIAVAWLALMMPSKNAFAGSVSGPENVVVICSNCTFPGLPQKDHVIMMDSKTGDIWAYSNSAIIGKEKPVYIGTLKTLGQMIKKEGSFR